MRGCPAHRLRVHQERVPARWSTKRSARPSGHYTDSGGLPMTETQNLDLQAMRLALIAGARALGFSQLGITTVEIPEDELHLLRWLEAGYHGEMDYMQRHGSLRGRPYELKPG